MNPKVSVIIPAYNNAKFLPETIESVLKQTFADWEIIIVDDGSTDNTQEVVAMYLQNHPGKIKYFRQENGGTAQARNRAIKESKGEYLGLLDADDLWLPEKLAVQVPIMEANPELALISSETYAIDAQSNRIGHWKVAKMPNTFECLFEANHIYNLTALARKSCVEKIGGYDETLLVSQDYDLWLRLTKRFPFKVLYVPLAQYRVHPNNISKNTKIRLKNHFYILNKKEISGDLGFWVKRERLAKLYYQFAKLFVEEKKFLEAGICFLKIAYYHPFFGALYWPPETKKIRFSLPYRVLKIYGQGIYYILKGVFQKS